MKFAGRRRKDIDEDDVVEAGEIGVNVFDDDDEQVEFVGLGQRLGEFGGGNRSISDVWMGLKCVWSELLLAGSDDDDEGIVERRLRDCWAVVNKLLLDSSWLDEGDSLGEIWFRLKIEFISTKLTGNWLDQIKIHCH